MQLLWKYSRLCSHIPSAMLCVRKNCWEGKLCLHRCDHTSRFFSHHFRIQINFKLCTRDLEANPSLGAVYIFECAAEFHQSNISKLTFWPKNGIKTVLWRRTNSNCQWYLNQTKKSNLSSSLNSWKWAWRFRRWIWYWESSLFVGYAMDAGRGYGDFFFYSTCWNIFIEKLLENILIIRSTCDSVVRLVASIII